MEQIERRKFPFKILFLIILTFGLIYFLFQFFSNPTFSEEKAEYRDLENAILFEGTIYSEKALEIEGELFFPYSFVKKMIDPNIFLDKKSETFIITTSSKVIKLPKHGFYMEEDEIRSNFKNPVIFIEKGVEEEENIYFSLGSLFGEVYPYAIRHSEDTGAIIIEKHGTEVSIGMIKEDIEEGLKRIRQDPDLSVPYVGTIENGEEVMIEKESGNFFYVRKNNGIAGYVRKSSFSKIMKGIIDTGYEEETFHMANFVKKPINLTWEPVYNHVNPNLDSIGKMEGVTIVSPTWFELEDGSGNISNMGSRNYVYWAKSRGYDIWGVFTNYFDPERTHLAIRDFETRRKMIEQLLEFAELYSLDGLNIDFENVNLEDRDNFTQFIRELTPYAHKNNLVVSVDITFISTSENWSMFYDRERLSEVADYIVVMAYDEHWGSSSVAGSVSSFPWVRENLERLLEVVPKEKLILGIPTYTRLWSEQKNENGEVVVSSNVFGINGIQNWIKENNLEIVYDEKTGQNYVEFYNSEEDVTYKSWIEDTFSLKKRVEIMHEYELAGVASWHRQFTSEEAWEEIAESLKNH